MRADELDFDLPAELIAQTPTADRAASRLLRYRRETGEISHGRFGDLPRFLLEGDLLVFNDAQVLPARFLLRKETGGVIEGLFLAQVSAGRWRVLLRNFGSYGSRRLTFEAAPELGTRVVLSGGAGEFELEVEGGGSAIEVLARVGRMPLPPYIKREKSRDDRDAEDRVRYQTVYAKALGSVAAPTAGLHFTPELLGQLEKAGVERTFVTLHVGMGTFKPVTVDRLEDHVMHTEAYTISTEAAEALNRAKGEGRRIVAVGTTSARVLESQDEGGFVAKSGETGIFIRPGYAWKHTGALITNFHLPRSTLIALVAAFVGLEMQRELYRKAIAERYRFFSYGDAMLLE